MKIYLTSLENVLQKYITHKTDFSGHYLREFQRDFQLLHIHMKDFINI